MVDIKYFKPVSATLSGTAGAPGSFPVPVAPGASVSETLTTIGTGYATIINSTGTLEVELVDDNSAASATPTGMFVASIFRSTLPTYGNGDGAVLHVDSRGRLLVASIDLNTGSSASIATEDSAGPTNPVGDFPLGLYRASLPSYTDGDAACFHFASNGRLLVSSNPTLPTTGTTTSVAGAAADTEILASNSNRLGATIVNEQATDGTGASLYLLLDNGTASLTDYTVQLGPNDYYEVPFGYTGEIRGIWTSAAGDARVTELT